MATQELSGIVYTTVGARVFSCAVSGFESSKCRTKRGHRKLSGEPNDSFLTDPLKRYFRLSGVPLKLCGFILGRAIIFLSVRSF